MSEEGRLGAQEEVREEVDGWAEDDTEERETGEAAHHDDPEQDERPISRPEPLEAARLFERQQVLHHVRTVQGPDGQEVEDRQNHVHLDEDHRQVPATLADPHQVEQVLRERGADDESGTARE